MTTFYRVALLSSPSSSWECVSRCFETARGARSFAARYLPKYHAVKVYRGEFGGEVILHKQKEAA